MMDFGHEPVQAALAEPNRAAGYCASDASAQGEAGEPSRVAGTVSSGPQADSQEGICPADMVEVAGDYCQVVEQVCEEYISEKKDRCAKYRNKVRCFGKSRAMHFCVDRYEYPNQAGVKPTVSVTWDEARELCATEGKRLCTADEWTQACDVLSIPPIRTASCATVRLATTTRPISFQMTARIKIPRPGRKRSGA